MATKAVGGDFYDLGSEDSTLAFQPLSDIDQQAEASWALEWITTLVEHEGEKVTPEKKTAIKLDSGNGLVVPIMVGCFVLGLLWKRRG